MDSKLLGQQYYYGIATYNVNQLTTWDWTPKSTLKQQLRVPKSRATGSPSHCSNKHCTAVEVGSGNRFRWRSYQSDCHKPLHPPPSYSLNPPPSEGATLCKHHLYGSVDVWGLFARMWAGVSTKIGKATLRDDIAGPTLHTNVLPKHRASLAKSWPRMTSQPNSRDRCRRSCLATLAAWIPRQVGRQVGIQVS